MANQMAMSLQARRVGPVVATGISLATTGILVAGPAIAPYVTAREAQVAAEAHKALSTAQVNLAALSDALLAFSGGGPVGALLAGVVGPDAQTAFQNGGPVGALLFALAGDNADAQAIAAAFQSGGPVGAVLTALVGADLTTAFQDGGPVGAALFALVGPDLQQAFQNGGPVGAALFALVGPDLQQAFQNGGPVGAALFALVGPDLQQAFQNGGPVGAVLTALATALTPPAADSMTSLAAQQEASTPITEASTPITSLRGLFGRNAEANTGGSLVDLSTPSLVGKVGQSDPTIEANAQAPQPFRDALPDPLQAVESNGPVVDVPKTPLAAVGDTTDDVPKTPLAAVGDKTDDGTKAPLAAVRDKADVGSKGSSGDGKGLVRNSLQFKPDNSPWLDGGSGGGGGGGGPLQGIKDAIDKLAGGLKGATG
jgi:hypothetical protein